MSESDIHITRQTVDHIANVLKTNMPISIEILQKSIDVHLLGRWQDLDLSNQSRSFLVQAEYNIMKALNSRSWDIYDLRHLAKYLFAKSMETKFIDEIYSCDNETSQSSDRYVHYDYDAIATERVRTNLPLHIEFVINDLSSKWSTIQVLHLVSFEGLIEQLFTIQLIGYSYVADAYNYFSYKGYQTSKILCGSEIMLRACNMLDRYLREQGYRVEGTLPLPESVVNIIARNNDNTLCCIMVRPAISPNYSFVLDDEVKRLYRLTPHNAIPYIADVSLRSADENHFKDGIILEGDKWMYAVKGLRTPGVVEDYTWSIDPKLSLPDENVAIGLSKNDPIAQYDYAVALFSEYNEKNRQTVVNFLIKSANQNYTPAFHRLALLLLSDKTANSNSSALKWLKRGAEMHHEPCMLLLAELMYEGKIIESDIDSAYYYFSTLKENKVANSYKKKIERIYKNEIEAFFNNLYQRCILIEDEWRHPASDPIINAMMFFVMCDRKLSAQWGNFCLRQRDAGSSVVPVGFKLKIAMDSGEYIEGVVQNYHFDHFWWKYEVVFNSSVGIDNSYPSTSHRLSISQIKDIIEDKLKGSHYHFF